jgi:hypothetical protein
MFYSGPISRAWLATEKFLGRRLMQVGLLEDQTLNVLDFGGDANMTVSVHTAEAAAAGKWWGCVGCRFLSRAVQRDHCTLVMSPTFTMPEGAAIRAFVLITAVLVATFALPILIAWAAIHFIL